MGELTPGPPGNRKLGSQHGSEIRAETPRSRAERLAKQNNATLEAPSSTAPSSLPNLAATPGPGYYRAAADNDNGDEDDHLAEEEDDFMDDSPILSLRRELSMRSSRIFELDNQFLNVHQAAKDEVLGEGSHRDPNHAGEDGVGLGKWEGRKSFFLGAPTTKDKKTEAIRLTMMGGILPPLYRKILKDEPDSSLTHAEIPLAEQRRELLDQLDKIIGEGTFSHINNSSSSQNLAETSQRCLWHMLPSFVNDRNEQRQKRRSNREMSSLKDINEAVIEEVSAQENGSQGRLPAIGDVPSRSSSPSPPRGKGKSASHRRSSIERSTQFSALSTSFSLNFLIFPALEQGKEISAIKSILSHAQIELDCEISQLCIIDPLEKKVNVAFNVGGAASWEGHDFTLVDNIFETTLLTGVGVNYYRNVTSEEDSIGNFPSRVLHSELGLEKKYRNFTSQSVLTIPVLDTNLSIVAILLARNRKGGQPFTYTDELRLASISQTITIVLHQCHIQEHLLATRRNMDTVIEMVMKSSNEIKFSKTVETLKTSAEAMIGGDKGSTPRSKARAVFLVYDKGEEALRVVSNGFEEPRIVKFGEGIVGKVAATKEETIIEDASKDDRFDSARDVFIKDIDVRNMLCVPVMDHQKRIIAVLVVYNKPWSFTSADVDHMRVVGNCAGIVLRKAQMFQDVKDSQRTEQALAKLGKEVYKSDTEGGDLMVLLNKISDLVKDTLGCEKVTMFLIDQIEEELWCAISQDLVGVRIKLGVGIAGSVAKDAKTLNIKDAYGDSRFSKDFDSVTGFKTNSILTVPVINEKGKVLGVLQCINKGALWEGHTDLVTAYFNDKDTSIVGAFNIELAELLMKNASQLQVMKSIADAHSEDYKRRRASSVMKKSIDSNTLEELKRRAEEFKISEEFSDSDFSDIDEGDGDDDQVIILTKDQHDESKLRRHSMLMRHHNLTKGDGFNRYLLSNHSNTRTKSIFSPRLSGSNANLNADLFGFDPNTHTVIKDMESWHCEGIFDASLAELIELCSVIFHKMRLSETYRTEDEVTVNFVKSICGQYRVTNPYHNFLHATSVMHMAYKMVKSASIYPLSQFEILAMLIAAMCHDVDHTGKDNDFEIQCQTELAITYNDHSVLENHHVATCFRISRQSERHNIFANLQKKQYKQARKIIIDCIISTDMKNHFSMVSNIEKSGDLEKDNRETTAMNLILHACDIGSLLSPTPMAEKWTERVVTEFSEQAKACYENDISIPAHMVDLGSRSKQAKLQVDFIDYIVHPIWALLEAKDAENVGPLMGYLKETRNHFENNSN
ncbi:hypothetical protein TrVE_jg5224 [Triparma verrucosa]|uniref:Phosphodiesterase n=1 Tax=Triparma verrucosa TaxID=1606542 RepID=A0A9W7B586_9STRA|nr:hypothetical protein TrVE_jg5224 [Triparma verrucosa]